MRRGRSCELAFVTLCSFGHAHAFESVDSPALLRWLITHLLRGVKLMTDGFDNVVSEKGQKVGCRRLRCRRGAHHRRRKH